MSVRTAVVAAFPMVGTAGAIDAALAYRAARTELPLVFSRRVARSARLAAIGAAQASQAT